MIIKEGKNYRLELEVTNYRLELGVFPYGDLFSVELYQTFPEAQRPRRQRLVQLNLTGDELIRLREGLQ